MKLIKVLPVLLFTVTVTACSTVSAMQRGSGQVEIADASHKFEGPAAKEVYGLILGGIIETMLEDWATIFSKEKDDFASQSDQDRLFLAATLLECSLERLSHEFGDKEAPEAIVIPQSTTIEMLVFTAIAAFKNKVLEEDLLVGKFGVAAREVAKLQDSPDAFLALVTKKRQEKFANLDALYDHCTNLNEALVTQK